MRGGRECQSVLSRLLVCGYARTCVTLLTRTCVTLTRDPHDTDTDSTDDDEDVGGLGKFSHGNYGLVHQHWVEQIISSGSFAVHNTEAAEANHKICMRLASLRVRHLHAAKTKSYMLKYLCWHDLFSQMTE